MHSRYASGVGLVLAVVLAIGVAGCGNAGQASTSTSPPAPSDDLPPTWVSNEALWEAMAAGDPHPESVQWALTTAARASRLSSSASWLRTFFGQAPRGSWKVYVVVVHGDFTLPGYAGSAARARALLLVLNASHSLLVQAHTQGSYDLSGLTGVGTFAARPPIETGVWGRTLWAGGPFPGGPNPLGNLTVEVYEGGFPLRSDTPVATVKSDAQGFFTLQLPSGEYTFLFPESSYGRSSPTTVDIEAGKATAVPISANVP
jgi:hypothetical protein